jgi:hypothetical protein
MSAEIGSEFSGSSKQDNHQDDRSAGNNNEGGFVYERQLHETTYNTVKSENAYFVKIVSRLRICEIL